MLAKGLLYCFEANLVCHLGSSVGFEAFAHHYILLGLKVDAQCNGPIRLYKAKEGQNTDKIGRPSGLYCLDFLTITAVNDRR